jgi:hypothetical protein
LFALLKREQRKKREMLFYTRLKKLFERAGLTREVFILIVKGALPPTVAIAMYRSPRIATVYGNFGFLIALASILSLHLQPRARFQQNIALATVWLAFKLEIIC